MNRCERNNNPLNIVRGSAWKGMKPVEKRTDSRFCEFVSPEYGFRAAWMLLRTYLNRHGIGNLRALIWRWCPDNTAKNYTNWVSRKSGVRPEDPLCFQRSEYDKLSRIMLFMARFEGYATKSEEEVLKEIKKGWELL